MVSKSRIRAKSYVLTDDAAVAGALFFLSRHSGLDRLDGLGSLLWRNLLCDAGVNPTVLDGSFDQPVIFTVTSDTSSNASGAQVEVTHLTYAAVIMFADDRVFTIVAINAKVAGAEIIEVWNGRSAQIGGGL